MCETKSFHLYIHDNLLSRRLTCLHDVHSFDLVQICNKIPQNKVLKFLNFAQHWQRISLGCGECVFLPSFNVLIWDLIEF